MVVQWLAHGPINYRRFPSLGQGALLPWWSPVPLPPIHTHRHILLAAELHSLHFPSLWSVSKAWSSRLFTSQLAPAILLPFIYPPLFWSPSSSCLNGHLHIFYNYDALPASLQIGKFFQTQLLHCHVLGHLCQTSNSWTLSSLKPLLPWVFSGLSWYVCVSV